MSYIFSKSVLDSDWGSHAFRIQPKDVNDSYILKRRYYTTSARSFVDTSWGGHFAVNPFPQFTRNCDLNHKSIYTGNNLRNGGIGDFGGVGRWWSETLDDNQQEIHIRAGVVRFNSMFTFFTNFYSVDASILSRRGRATSLFYSLGKGAGYVGTIMLQPFILGAEAWNFFLSTPRTKFYYLQPAMHAYWSAVSSMMNTYMVNVGLTSFFDADSNVDTDKKFYDPVITDYNNLNDWKEQNRIYASQFGDRMVTKHGGIDVFAISTRAQRLSILYRNRVDKEMNDFMSNATVDNRNQLLEQFVDTRLDTILGNLPGPAAIQEEITKRVDNYDPSVSLLEHYTKFQFQTEYNGKNKEASGALTSESNAGDGSSDLMPNSVLGSAITGSDIGMPSIFTEDQTGETQQEEQGFFEELGDKWWDYFTNLGNSARGNMEMGAEFVTFRVNNTGSQSESFSNTSGESGLMETINSNSSSARSARFNIMGGNIGGGIGTVLQAAEEIVGGMLDSVKLGGLMALGGSAFVDIQKVYQNSSADMMTTSITIPLRAWSADPWTIAKDIAYPLFCILALGMPKSTGNRSYDEPFLIETFLRGRSQIREGRVRSISITRGVGDVAWTKDGHALGIDVNVEIEDMSGVVGVPINPATSRIVAGATGIVSNTIGLLSPGAAEFVDDVTAKLSVSTYSEDNKFGDYMNVLGAVDLHRQINTFQKWKVRAAQTRVQMEQWRSPHALLSGAFDTLPGRLIQAIGRPTDRN